VLEPSTAVRNVGHGRHDNVQQVQKDNNCLALTLNSRMAKVIMSLAEASSTEESRLAGSLLVSNRSRPAHHEAAVIRHVEP
jgi:hypothetical protein